jgi:hypothetical protein
MLEIEIARSAAPNDVEWSGGLDVLYRSGSGRMSTFAGGGGFFVTSHHEGVYGWTANGLRGQAVAGADIQVVGPLKAYGSAAFGVAFLKGSDSFAVRSNWRVAAGIRLVARTSSSDSVRH